MAAGPRRVVLALGAATALPTAYALCAVVFVATLAALAAAGPDPRRVRLAEALE